MTQAEKNLLIAIAKVLESLAVRSAIPVDTIRIFQGYIKEAVEERTSDLTEGKKPL